MKAIKIIFNIFGILLAIIFGFFTFCSLIVTPVVSAGTDIFQPDTIQQLLQDMNLSKQLESTLKESVPAELQNIDASFIDDLMDSELINDVLQLYIDNLLGVLENDHIESINQQQIQNLLDKHTPELVSMLRPYLPSDFPFTDQEVSKYANDMVKPALTTMVSSLPTLEDLGVDNTTLTVIHMLYDGSLLKHLFIAIFILSLLVFLFRFPGLKGFMWLGIIYLLSAVVLFLTTANVNILVDIILPPDSVEKIDFALQPIVELFKEKFFWGGRNAIILSSFFIVFFTITRIFRFCKKKSAKENLAA